MIRERPARRRALRWAGWLGIANAAAMALIALRYLGSYPFGGAAATLYVALTWVGQFALLAVLPLLLVLAPLLLLRAPRWALLVAAAATGATQLTLIVLDTSIFAEHRFHLSALSAALFETTTWVLAGVQWLILFGFELLLADLLWKSTDRRPRMGGRLVAAAVCLCWIGSQGMHAWADATGDTRVTQLTRYLPLYFPLKAKRRLAKLGWVDPEVVRQRRALRGAAGDAGGQLRYPLAPLTCTAPAAGPRNVLMILLDALRPDIIDPALLPNIAGLRDRAGEFTNHYSGGNSSRMGVFSMFYGLPSTYWQAFNDLQRPPVLLDELRRQGYALGLYSAVGFGSPTLIDRTVFAGEPGLGDERGELSATERNAAITADWLRFLDARAPGAAPFFGFLYYDPPMPDMPAAGEPLPLADRYAGRPAMAESWYRYRAAQRSLDAEVGRVLADLSRRGLDGDTVILLLSDHGYEFDDSGLGYTGHASSFSRHQLRATLLAAWPGRPAARLAHRSSHYDIPATLLSDVLGCSNPPADYSVGSHLYDGEDWEWLIAGSYTAHAIIAPGQTVVSHPGGFIEVLGDDYRAVPGAELDLRVVEDAMLAMRRFFR